MKLAVSNIAWAAEEEPEMARVLSDLGVQHVEIAPPKVFPDPLLASEMAWRQYSQFWHDHGITIVAFQSLLFGRPECTLFGDKKGRTRLINVLSRFINIAGEVGVERLVFGSPKNRQVPPEMSLGEARDIAADVFSSLGVVAADSGTCLCIEPNPSVYDCNFVTTAAAGLELVETVGNPGFGLHLDSACMALAGDPVINAVNAAGVNLRHFHVSAPNLGALEDIEVDHASAAAALRSINYDGFVSIEMRMGEPGASASAVGDAVGLARRYYAE